MNCCVENFLAGPIEVCCFRYHPFQECIICALAFPFPTPELVPINHMTANTHIKSTINLAEHLREKAGPCSNTVLACSIAICVVKMYLSGQPLLKRSLQLLPAAELSGKDHKDSDHTVVIAVMH